MREPCSAWRRSVVSTSRFALRGLSHFPARNLLFHYLAGVRHGRPAHLRRIKSLAPLSHIAANILAAVANWGKQQDDQTLLIVRCFSNI
jgi:hypothetical protein